MATANQPAEQTAELLKNLSLDSQTKTHEVADANKKPGEVNVSVPSSDRSVTPVLPEFIDPNYYYGGYPSPTYYYGSYDPSMNEWGDDYSKYVSPDGSGVYGDMYGYGYQTYAPYSPAGSVPTMGHDGLYGPQQYQYPTPYYQSPTPTSGAYTPNQAPTSQGEVPTSVAADQTSLPVEAANGNAKGSGNGNSNGNSNGAAPLRTSNPNTSLNSNGSSGKGVFAGGLTNTGYQDPRFNFDGMRSHAPWIDGSAFTDVQHRPATSSSLSSTYSRSSNIQPGRNPNLQHLPNLMGLQHPRHTSGMGPTPGFVNRVYPNNRYYSHYGTAARTGGFPSNGYDYRTNGRGWFNVDGKYKPKGRGNGFGYSNENLDGFNEMSRGPRSRGFKKQTVDAPITLAVRGQSISSNVSNQEKDNSGVVPDKENSSVVPDKDNSGVVPDKDNSGVVPDKEQYNREDFPVNYTEAKFFIIKSYSEDDVHKSIKYSVWASTPNGNKKLDAGYQGAQERTGGCPVFLFFSVNTSGQFVGLAEMVGPVDFDKTVDYWQQDKWNGCFPVKWHIVKDVPNSLLKHITLENNDNKPVTNSRDTQEVKFDQGLQMLKIFKEYTSKTFILDDFEFYESRQKTVQEKKAKQQLQFQKQATEGKPTDAVSDEKENGVANGQQKSQNSLDDGSAAVSNQATIAAAQGNGEHKQSEESELVEDKDAPKGAKTVTVKEKRVVVNGVTNGY